MAAVCPCLLALNRRRLLVATAAVAFATLLSPRSSYGQFPWGLRLNFGKAPDEDDLIPEYVVNGAGGIGGFAGFSTLFYGDPIILYDPAWFQLMEGPTGNAFRFARAHEYGHHRLGHVLTQLTSPPSLLPILGYQTELEADCWAVTTLLGNGDQVAANAGIAIYQQVLPAFDSGGRPGAAARIQNMSRCSN